MKGNTFSIIIAVTITLTLFVAIEVCALNPFNETSTMPFSMEEKERLSTPPEFQMQTQDKASEPLDSSEEESKVDLLLSDSEFQSALSNALEKKLGDEKVAESLAKSIIETDAFKSELSSYLSTYDASLSTTSPDSGVSTSDGKAHSSRSAEIEKALEYMGY